MTVIFLKRGNSELHTCFMINPAVTFKVQETVSEWLINEVYVTFDLLCQVNRKKRGVPNLYLTIAFNSTALSGFTPRMKMRNDCNLYHHCYYS